MVSKVISIRKIFQKDNHTFTIEWMDGEKHDFRLSDLQEKCPCAACNNQKSGHQKEGKRIVDSNVRASKIESIGRYALKIHFTSGCCYGIFRFDYLKNMGQKILKKGLLSSSMDEN